MRALLTSVVNDMPAFFPAWTLLTQTVTNNPSVPPVSFRTDDLPETRRLFVVARAILQLSALVCDRFLYRVRSEMPEGAASATDTTGVHLTSVFLLLLMCRNCIVAYFGTVTTWRRYWRAPTERQKVNFVVSKPLDFAFCADTMRSVQHYSRIASRDPYRIDSMDDYACELFTQSHGRLDDPQGRTAKVQVA